VIIKDIDTGIKIMTTTLSKTDYILYRECPNNVWVKKHKPEEYAKFEVSEFEKSLAVMGNEVEKLARGMFPAGYLVERRSEGAQELTQKLIAEGDMKECPKCKEIRSANDFKDSSLLTGYGRFCRYCKGHSSSHRVMRTTRSATITTSDKTCPKCGARMVLRNGRRGKFYGCSKFPYCKGTRSY